ncbi:MAG: hypothetical protein WC350_04240 [Candidatus Micrarchaeia archaeon]
MAPIPKTKMEAGEQASMGSHPRGEFRLIGGRTINKTAEQLETLERFRNTNFAGGTLVEYEEVGNGIEFRRGTVRTFSIIGTQLRVQTRGRAKLECDDIWKLRIEERGRAFHISGADIPPCMIAPAGVKIEKGPHIEEVLEQARADLAKKKDSTSNK